MASRFMGWLRRWTPFPALWFMTAAALIFGLLNGFFPHAAPPFSVGVAWITVVGFLGGIVGAPLWRAEASWYDCWRGLVIFLLAIPLAHLLWSWSFSLYWFLVGHWRQAAVNLAWSLSLALATSIRISISALMVLGPIGLISAWLLQSIAKRRDYWEAIDREKTV